MFFPGSSGSFLAQGHRSRTGSDRALLTALRVGPPSDVPEVRAVKGMGPLASPPGPSPLLGSGKALRCLSENTFHPLGQESLPSPSHPHSLCPGQRQALLPWPSDSPPSSDGRGACADPKHPDTNELPSKCRQGAHFSSSSPAQAL